MTRARRACNISGGTAPVTLNVPHVSPGFQRLERVVFASLIEEESVFYVDNITIAPVDE